MSHIFISYSRKDRKIVAEFVESLRKQDFIVWQDVSHILAGETWHQAMLDAVEKASAVIVFWTQAASLSSSVKDEIDHALKHDKPIIPVWLEHETPLGDGLSDKNAVVTSNFSASAAQKISHALGEVAPRIQRQVMAFNNSIPLNAQTIAGIKREMIGSKEYMIVPLVASIYSSAYVIAEAGSIVRSARHIQVIVQNTGPVDYSVVRQAFEAIAAIEQAEPVMALYVTGTTNPLKSTDYWVDNTNVAHYSDMIDTVKRATGHLVKDAAATQTLQIFQKTLLEIAFLLGASLDRWLPLQLFKFDGTQYVPIMNIPPRSPN